MFYAYDKRKAKTQKRGFIMDNERMGRFIAEQRKAKGMTQLDLANKLHITDKAISKWERGVSQS